MKEPKVLLTGISGFVGAYLAEELDSRGWEVTGLALPGEVLDPAKEIFKKVRILRGNILDQDGLKKILAEADADYVLHLAAESAPSKSFKYPERFFLINVVGTQNLLEAVRLAGTVKMLAITTSSDIYGLVGPDQVPVTEDAPLQPLNPYSASKAACHHIARQYSLNFNVPVLEIRPFNMVGPGQLPGFVLPDWASQIARIMNKKAAPRMLTGRLTDQRDFVDVRDAARAMADLLEKGKAGEAYQICSGRGTVVRELLDLLLAKSGMDIEVGQNPDLMRPTKMPVLYGSHEKLSSLTGWQPAISLEDTVGDVLDYWLNKP